jgi:hypothetical protein
MGRRHRHRDHVPDDGPLVVALHEGRGVLAAQTLAVGKAHEGVAAIELHHLAGTQGTLLGAAFAAQILGH